MLFLSPNLTPDMGRQLHNKGKRLNGKFKFQIFTFSPFTSPRRCQSFNCARVFLMLWTPQDSYVLCLWFGNDHALPRFSACLTVGVFSVCCKIKVSAIDSQRILQWNVFGLWLPSSERVRGKILIKEYTRQKRKQWKWIDEEIKGQWSEERKGNLAENYFS